MSQVSYQSKDAVVFDDVLSSPDFARLFQYLNSLQYRRVHDIGWQKVWRLHDGNPLSSRPSWYSATPAAQGASQEEIYPTHTPLDNVVGWILQKLPEVEAWVGKSTVDWSRFSITPWLYPPGSGLSLHQDDQRYSGAFTYFAHPEWGLHWGGHLMLLDPRTPQASPQKEQQLSPPFLSDGEETARIFSPGLAMTVLAKPNRMVFIAPNAQHMVTRVDANAGQAARVSVAGFFHKV